MMLHRGAVWGRWGLRRVPTSSFSSMAALDHFDLEEIAERVRLDGVAMFPDSHRASENFTSKAREIVLASYHDALERAGGSIQVGQAAGFSEIIQRAEGRFDMLHGIEGNDFILGEEGPYRTVIEPFAREVLGENCVLQFNGALLSLPAAAEQLWHADGEHLFFDVADQPSRGIRDQDQDFSIQNLPPHCLNVFVPLVNVSEQNGGTEFALGSHLLTGHLKTEEVVWQRDKWLGEIESLNGGPLELTRIQAQRGQLLAFDYRILHRALQHQGDLPRPVLYFTFVKRWFRDSLNFACLPDLPPIKPDHAGGVGARKSQSGVTTPVERTPKAPGRAQYRMLDDGRERIFADGAAGTQVPALVTDAMVDHLTHRNANVGGAFATSEETLAMVTQARQSAAALFLRNEAATGQIIFGQNCTNLLFHLSRSFTFDRKMAMAGEDVKKNAKKNIVISSACHDANIAPWIFAAEMLDYDIRWLQCTGQAEGDCTLQDVLDPLQLESLVDENTEIIAVGLASNATGRVHSDFIAALHERVVAVFGERGERGERGGRASRRPLVVLDGTHYFPHYRVNDLLLQVGDVLVSSPYKYCGPHMGIMALTSPPEDLGFGAMKVGRRPNDSGDVVAAATSASASASSDVLFYGPAPNEENCEISPWEMGTLNYEALAGFDALVRQYFAKMDPPTSVTTNPRDPAGQKSLVRKLDSAFDKIMDHERDLSACFLDGIRDLVDRGCLRLHGGGWTPDSRTPTFGLSLPTGNSPTDLVNFLNERQIYCTHGNHYAPALVDEQLQVPDGLTRLSFIHYNTREEVESIVRSIHDFFDRD